MDEYLEQHRVRATDVSLLGGRSREFEDLGELDYEHAHANEFASQLVAYTSPYLFWITVSAICAGYLVLF